MQLYFRHIILILLLVFGAAGQARQVAWASDGQPELEYKLKAAFLFNFARFAKWPRATENPSAPFVFCVVGQDPFGPALRALQERSIGDKAIKLHYAGSAPDGLDQCQVLFISKSESQTLQHILNFTNGKPIITVSDIDGFAAASGMFEFINTEGKLSFIINNSVALGNGIHVSSSLLNLAYKVQ